MPLPESSPLHWEISRDGSAYMLMDNHASSWNWYTGWQAVLSGSRACVFSPDGYATTFLTLEEAKEFAEATYVLENI